MSTRGSLWFHESEDGVIHLYTELHDQLVHLLVNDGSNAEVNIALPVRHGILLSRALNGEIKEWKGDLTPRTDT